MSSGRAGHTSQSSEGHRGCSGETEDLGENTGFQTTSVWNLLSANRRHRARPPLQQLAEMRVWFLPQRRVEIRKAHPS